MASWGKHPIGAAGFFAYVRAMKKDAIFQTGAVAEAWATNSLQREPHLPQRILVVDDDPLIRQLNRKVLAYSCYQVDTAENGAAAWDALLANDYDLLITDNDLPKGTGMNLLEKVHATRMAMPVVMATGAVTAGELAQYPGWQPDAVLIKPYTFVELLETVRKVLHPTVAA